MPNYTIRVYGILEHEGRVLISSEVYREVHMFKFPGGGMEEGEGTKEALIREFQEEMSLDIEVGEHVYTTDFHTVSTFDPECQVMSIYYRVSATIEGISNISTEEKGTIPSNKKESFQWYPIEELSYADFTFLTEQAAWKAFLS